MHISLKALRRILLVGVTIWLLLALCSCDDAASRLGSAQHASVEAEAHAQATRTAAEQAIVDAADAEARAVALAAAAEKLPTAERIAAAADARVDAASKKAVSEALTKVADAAGARARDATEQAGIERKRESQAASDASWLWTCRAIALGCLVGGAVLGFLIGYATHDPRIGLWVGAGLTGIGLLVLAFGVALPWLAWLVPIGGVGALVVWVVKHRGLHLEHLTLEGAHLELGKAREALAAGYVRTAEALGKVAPEIRRDLDLVSVREQRDAGVLHLNTPILARLVDEHSQDLGQT